MTDIKRFEAVGSVAAEMVKYGVCPDPETAIKLATKMSEESDPSPPEQCVIVAPVREVVYSLFEDEDYRQDPHWCASG